MSASIGSITLNRMQIEILKVSLYVELATDARESGFSVVIFVNFTNTLEYLCKHLDTECIIKGGQTIQERNQNIDDFQSNKKKIIIVMIQAGGTGISLHDIHGNHPRMSLISLSLSGLEIKQAMGRIHRAGSKTPAIQKIICVANTYEERMLEIIEKKLKNIDIVNNGCKLSEDKLSEDKISEDEISKDEISEDKISKDKISEDKIS